MGHEFFYEYDGVANYFVVDRPNANEEQVIAIGRYHIVLFSNLFYVSCDLDNVFSRHLKNLGGREGEGIRVRCEITTESTKSTSSFDILVQLYWAPRGAVRFLELVRAGYYDGVVFNRVVPKFLIQFGIAKEYDFRMEGRKYPIWDDFDIGMKFEPGYVSYAGSGHDSRTTEIFIAMPGASEDQLRRFGENSWETPFGFVEGDLSVLSQIYSGYGDMVSGRLGQILVSYEVLD